MRLAVPAFWIPTVCLFWTPTVRAHNMANTVWSLATLALEDSALLEDADPVCHMAAEARESMLL